MWTWNWYPFASKGRVAKTLKRYPLQSNYAKNGHKVGMYKVQADCFIDTNRF